MGIEDNQTTAKLFITKTAENSWFHPSIVFFIISLLLCLWIYKRYNLRRAAQAFFMSLFITLLWMASFDGHPMHSLVVFLIVDPLLALVHTISAGMLVNMLLFSFVTVLFTVILGRLFCSHICPMGTLFDISDKWLSKPQKFKENRENYKKVRIVKFIFLFVIIGAAFGGLNLLGFGDPIVIFTRFAATIFYPIGMLLQDAGLLILRPIGDKLGWAELSYYQLIIPKFEGSFFMMATLVIILLLGVLQSRFWCRHICPLGALFSILAKFSPYKRRVNDKCNNCNKCVRKCPTGAIHAKGIESDKSECIICLNCVNVCPEQAVKFVFTTKIIKEQDNAGIFVNRRNFIWGITGGITANLCLKSDLLHPSNSFLPMPLRHKKLIRPPGALLEPEFLSRCVRCGECMRACLTNTLQPDWYRTGIEGLWAPYMNLRHAACEQTCNVCGKVCPTKAIRDLSIIEKQYAKVGTAVIDKNRCLPWVQDKRCLICDEQCPYNAIVFIYDSNHKVNLPVVDANKCNGCGQCEDKCPIIGDSAILVEPQGEVRLSKGSYVEEAKNLGLVFESKKIGVKKEQFRLEDDYNNTNNNLNNGEQLNNTEKNDAKSIEKKKEPKLPPGIEFD